MDREKMRMMWVGGEWKDKAIGVKVMEKGERDGRY